VAKTKVAKYKRARKTKRDPALLTRLREEFGDVPLSEAIDRLRNRRPGPRRKWDVHRLFDIFMCVEAFKARGVNPTEAWRQAAKFHGLEVKVVEHVWTRGRDRFAGLFKGHESEILKRHVADRPRLRSFLQELKTTPKT
jgi:hypothetical protein